MKKGLSALALMIFLSGVCIAGPLPPGPGADLVYSKCQTCHGLNYVVESKGISKRQWESTIEEMEGYGLQVTPEEKEKIIQYLSSYMGPNPPPAVAEKPPEKLNGSKLFQTNCASCHQENGKGITGLFPPLAGNPYLFKDEYPVLVVLFGLAGPIKVQGEEFKNSMPSFSHLSDEEIASIINYIRKAWGNAKFFKKGVTPQEVARYRNKKLTEEKVHEYRENK